MTLKCSQSVSLHSLKTHWVALLPWADFFIQVELLLLRHLFLYTFEFFFSFRYEFYIFFYFRRLLHGKIFTRPQIVCRTHIEFPYYSSGVERLDICCFCCRPDVQPDKELKKFTVVLSVCNNCVTVEKQTIPKRMLIKK